MKKEITPVFEVRIVPCPPEQEEAWFDALALWWRMMSGYLVASREPTPDSDRESDGNGHDDKGNQEPGINQDMPGN